MLKIILIKKQLNARDLNQSVADFMHMVQKQQMIFHGAFTRSHFVQLGHTCWTIARIKRVKVFSSQTYLWVIFFV